MCGGVVALMYSQPWLGPSWAYVWAEGAHVSQGGAWGSPATVRMLPPGYQVGIVGVATWQGGRPRHPQRWRGHPKIYSLAEEGNSWLGRAVSAHSGGTGGELCNCQAQRTGPRLSLWGAVACPAACLWETC